jgi:TP901 family phage tail tape measure protein
VKVLKIINIFSQLGDLTAAGPEEIGEALQRVASAAENSNISLEKSASWIATISSITRESPSTIGRSLNSAISRYESIKKTGFNSEDPTKLNDVVLALSQIGIKATDSQGQLKDFSEILDLIGSRFSSLSKNEKAYIATTMFGKICHFMQ